LQTLSKTSTHPRESILHFRDANKERRGILVRQEEQQAQQVEQQFRAVFCQYSLWESW
jgi:hypothetical protein